MNLYRVIFDKNIPVSYVQEHGDVTIGKRYSFEYTGDELKYALVRAGSEVEARNIAEQIIVEFKSTPKK